MCQASASASASRQRQYPPLYQVPLLCLMPTVCAVYVGARVFRRLVVFMMCDSLNIGFLFVVELPGSALGLSVYSATPVQAAGGLLSSAALTLAHSTSSNQTPAAFSPFDCAERKLVDSNDFDHDGLTTQFGNLRDSMGNYLDIRFIDNLFGYAQIKHDANSIVRVYKKCTVRDKCICWCVCFVAQVL